MTRCRGHQPEHGNAAFLLEKQVKSSGCSRSHLLLCFVSFPLQETFGERRVFVQRGTAFAPAACPGKGGVCAWVSKGVRVSFLFSLEAV